MRLLSFAILITSLSIQTTWADTVLTQAETFLNNKQIVQAYDLLAPLEDQLKTFFDETIAKEQAGLAPGEAISYDRWTEILGDVIRKYKAETASPGGARDQNGNFKDFIEVRRPFVEPSHEGHAQ